MHKLHSWTYISQVLYYFVRIFAAIIALQYEWGTEHTKDVHWLIGHFLDDLWYFHLVRTRCGHFLQQPQHDFRIMAYLHMQQCVAVV